MNDLNNALHLSLRCIAEFILKFMTFNRVYKKKVACGHPVIIKMFFTLLQIFIRNFRP